MKTFLILLAAASAAFAQSDRAEAARNPFTGNAQAIAAGRTIYAQACTACHGADARGDRGPSLVSGNLSRGNADGEVFLNIRNGIRGTQMPGFSQFTTDQTWQLISYIRSLSGVGPATTTSADNVAGNAVAGKALFEGKAGCAGCHMVAGAGGAAGPDLTAAGKLPVAQLLGKINNPNAPAAAAPGGRGGGRGRGAVRPATVIAKTKDGKEYRGAQKGNDAASILMTDMQGAFHSFDKASLLDLKVEQKSLMPDDYAKKLTGAEINDVVAYLKSLDGSDLTKLAAGKGIVTWDRLKDAGKEPQNYMMYWGDLSGQHYSQLNQVNAQNVKSLQAKWALQMPGDGVVQAIPLVVDGIMYTTGPAGTSLEVRALDARTGRQLWRYDRRQKTTNPYEINRSNRGVSILGNRLFFGTLDAALVALDARTGAFLWEVQVADTMKGYSLTSPPLVVKDMVITGISGGEFGIPGFVEAYEPATGKKLWRWNTIPEPGEKGNETWAGDSWKRGAAATWLTGSYDPELDTLYWTTGNPGPDINGDVRLGDNLYSCSVVALDPKTGKLKWHYQFTPNDTHDWDATEDVILVDRMWHGQQRKLLLQANRNGIFYVLDRTNGQFLAGNPFVRASWQKGFDEKGRPITTEGWRASPEGVTVYPSLGGGSNFQAPSYSKQTGLMYFMYFDGPGSYSIGPAVFEPGRQYQGRGTGGGFGPPANNGQAPPSQGVQAFDPETGKTVWKFELSQNSLSPGVLSTAGGLVFAASAEGNFFALDAKTGKALWKFYAGAAIPSSPMSYSVDGKQYVAVSSANVLYSFALPD